MPERFGANKGKEGLTEMAVEITREPSFVVDPTALCWVASPAASSVPAEARKIQPRTSA